MSACLIKISDTLCKALSNRVRAISLSHATDSHEIPTFLDLGLVMELTQASRVVEYGPATDQAVAAVAFREFWGPKAETRRFKDGRILESVVWEAEGPSERVNIFVQIIKYILERHLSIPAANMKFFAGAYDALLLGAPQIRRALYVADPKDAGYLPLTAAFDYFVKELKALKGLPLAINSVLPAAEALRYSSTFIPSPLKSKSLPYMSTSVNHVPVNECILTFEGSGRWPDDLRALQKVKAAFLVRLGSCFQKSVRGSRCEILFDLEAAPKGENCSLDIVLPQGFAFRLRIHHPRERILLEDALLDGSLGEEERSEGQDLLVAYHRSYVAKPAHHAAISALQNRRTSFSFTVRIVKRWLAAHLLLPQIPAEVVELLCAKVFLDAESAFEVPASASAGFARVLDLLANWRWREEPLLVSLYASVNADAAQGLPIFTDNARQRILALFASKRRLDPAISRDAWVIATEEDLSGSAWGRVAPTKLIAGRVQDLARACLASLVDIMQAGDQNIEVRTVLRGD